MRPQHPLLASRYCLALADGRTIELAAFYQELTYLNLLSGYPTRSINTDLLRSHVRVATEQQHRLVVPLDAVLLDPTVTQLPFPPRPIGESLDPYESLPPILSVAVFDSDAVGATEACSSVLVVWYQDNWGLPSAPVVAQLRKLNWVDCASDWTW